VRHVDGINDVPEHPRVRALARSDENASGRPWPNALSAIVALKEIKENNL
jgi:hypothetical protein